MRYTVEDLSPVKKKIQMTVPADEAHGALTEALELYRSSVTLKGFRRGKAPAAMVEKRFHQEIYGDATSKLVSKNLDVVLRETSFIPVSRFEFDGQEISRGAEFTCAVTFETMPEFTLPPHEGLAVEQEEVIIPEQDVDTVLERMRSSRATPQLLAESRPPVDGDLIRLDFEGFDENGEPIPAVKGESLTVTLGQGRTLPDFEILAKTLRPGESGQGPVAFPEDYFHTELAGKTVTMHIRLIDIQERLLPDLDDAFAKASGPFSTLEELRRNIRDSYAKSRTEGHKAEAKGKLLATLLEQVEFPVPEGMLEHNISLAVADTRRRLARFGQNIDGFTQNPEQDLRAEMRPEALRRTREQILLLALARKHELTVSDGERDAQLHRMALQSGQSYAAAMENYKKNDNLLQAVTEHLLEEKALDLIYDKAVVTMVALQAETSADGPADKEMEKEPAGEKTPARAHADE